MWIGGLVDLGGFLNDLKGGR
jgi:hypothetical protein